MLERYEPATFDTKWRERWNAAKLFRTQEVEGRPKFYGLDFFPYPSGAGLSVGHCRNYVPTDVLCRMRRMQGYNVLHPMGFDAFGLPAENEAIAKKTHPAPMVQSYGENYRRQMDLVGVGYDWDRSFFSSDPEYYRWTQWIFELLYKKGLAYRRMASVNWCPKDATVLADEEVEAGLCWRCGTPVEKKLIPQWYFRITAYAQQLLDDLELIDWPEGIKSRQRNWIGRSEGVEFDMKVVLPKADLVEDDGFEVLTGPDKHLNLRVFTTRIDTIFGMTFCVIAPEHPMLEFVLPRIGAEQRSAVEAYIAAAANLSDIDRESTVREKTGIYLGVDAINPATGKPVPIFVADYVLMNYGTGGIMAVPGHDQRDFEFAVKFGLDVIPVIKPTPEYFAAHFKDEPDFETAMSAYLADPKAFNPVFLSKDSTLINSGEYSELSVSEAQTQLGEWMEGLGLGKRVVNFRLRDWLISRQRYWGCPIPVVHSHDGEIQLVPEDQLPVELPTVDHYEPSTDGSSPLSRIEEFVNVTDLDGKMGHRETDTMGGFACSSWYFLRFCDPFNDSQAWDLDRAKYWMPVDCYVGGAEHAVMHLLYARFWTKVLFDEGLVSVREPFHRLMNQGQVLAMTPYRRPRGDEKLQTGEEGVLISFAEAAEVQSDIDSGKLDADALFYRWARMSKSKGNVVTPDEMVDAYGADALRLYLLFVAPFEADVQWQNEGVAGASRFLNRVFRWISDVRPHFDTDWSRFLAVESVSGKALEVRRTTHRLVQKATADIERFAFNTYVSEMMKALNAYSDLMKAFDPQDRELVLAFSEAVENMILVLSAGAPFSADELWESLGKAGFTLDQHWPAYDEALTLADSWTIAVQVNGKLRETFVVDASTPEEAIKEQALSLPKVGAHLDGKTVRKIIVIPGKLVNVVAN